MDIPKELSKLSDKQEKLNAQIQRLQETMTSLGYEKVPLGIRNNNEERVNQYFFQNFEYLLIFFLHEKFVFFCAVTLAVFTNVVRHLANKES